LKLRAEAVILTSAGQTAFIEAVSLEAATDVTFAWASVVTVVATRSAFWRKTHLVNCVIAIY